MQMHARVAMHSPQCSLAWPPHGHCFLSLSIAPLNQVADAAQLHLAQRLPHALLFLLPQVCPMLRNPREPLLLLGLTPRARRGVCAAERHIRRPRRRLTCSRPGRSLRCASEALPLLLLLPPPPLILGARLTLPLGLEHTRALHRLAPVVRLVARRGRTRVLGGRCRRGRLGRPFLTNEQIVVMRNWAPLVFTDPHDLAPHGSPFKHCLVHVDDIRSDARGSAMADAVQQRIGVHHSGSNPIFGRQRDPHDLTHFKPKPRDGPRNWPELTKV
mmetsp:Transcript_30704/g.98068  ORF Transcript_30704/g.98068 Transcript_30704/m.98068 type:complete len:272 (-) Transcript_30704:942-1757(-)